MNVLRVVATWRRMCLPFLTLFAVASSVPASPQDDGNRGGAAWTSEAPRRPVPVAVSWNVTPLNTELSCISEIDERLVAQLLADYSATAHPSTSAALSSASLPLLKAYPQAGRWYGDLFTVNYVDLNPSAGDLAWDCSSWTYNGHNGSDTALIGFDKQALGIPVFAAWDGTVLAAHDGEPDMNTSWQNQLANFVVLDHGQGRLTRYWHLKKNSVAVQAGDVVRAGQQLGLTGSSGNSTGPHLHFELQENGQIVEPHSGACQTSPSRWEQQRPKPHSAYLQEFAFTRAAYSGETRTGQIALSDAHVYFWAFIPARPANSNWRVAFLRPNGTVAYGPGALAFGTHTASYCDWWYDIPELHTLPGDWTVQLFVNERLMISAPLNVAPAIDPSFNRAPEPIDVNFAPPNPAQDDVIHCRVETHLGRDDKDYDLLRYRYVWKVNGATVRDVTTGALSDAIPVGTTALGDQLACTVTPNDGTVDGPPAQVVRTINCLADSTVVVSGRANLFGAGHALPDAPGGGGIGYLPIEIPLAGIAGDIISFPSIAGVVSPSTAGSNNADGGTLDGGVTDVTSWDGIAGLIHGSRTMFLAGVFLGSDEPQSPAPARLNVTSMATATDVTPQLRQAFFVGDGLTGTGTGSMQRFHAPAGATRLCLGFVDGTSFLGAPGTYDGNSGSLTVRVSSAPLASCPCHGETYCAATTNSSGVAASISSLGTTSIGDASFTLVCDGLPSGAPGLFLYGTGQSFVAFGNGYRCVAPPSYRLPITAANLTGHAEQPLAFASPPQPAALITVGSTWNFQFWFRDNAAGGAAKNLSNGLHVTFCP